MRGRGSDDDEEGRRQRKRAREDDDDRHAKGQTSRIHALEDQLAAVKASQAKDAAKAEFLQNKLREVADRSKQRGNLLVTLIAALTRRENAKAAMETAKAELQAAEEHLAVVMQQATAGMSKEDQQAAAAMAANQTTSNRLASDGGATDPATTTHDNPQSTAGQPENSSRPADSTQNGRMPQTYRIPM